MTEKERMDKGLLYLPLSPQILKSQVECLMSLYEFNACRPNELDKRTNMLKTMFAHFGDNSYIEPPLHANWGGSHVSFGDNVYANFNLTLVDDGNITVGDCVMFAPNVTIATAGHPIEPTLRSKGYQYNKDVVIGDNVWIGAGVLVMPGVTIGNNSVIGAGSVVTKNIPSDVVAYGNPCKVIRPISAKDHKYFYKDQLIDWENI
ncbi:MAG: sugar O-acetyltransferase [Clostridia bacterium]